MIDRGGWGCFPGTVSEASPWCRRAPFGVRRLDAAFYRKSLSQKALSSQRIPTCRAEALRRRKRFARTLPDTRVCQTSDTALTREAPLSHHPAVLASAGWGKAMRFFGCACVCRNVGPYPAEAGTTYAGLMKSTCVRSSAFLVLRSLGEGGRRKW